MAFMVVQWETFRQCFVFLFLPISRVIAQLSFLLYPRHDYVAFESTGLLHFNIVEADVSFV